MRGFFAALRMTTQNWEALPGFPGGFAGGPEFFELLLVAEGVHGLPEAVVEEGLDFAFGDEGFDGLALEHPAIVLDLVDDFGGEDEEAAVDPAAFVLGFFLEGVDVVVLEAEGAEAGDGLDAGEGDQFAVGLVEGDGGLDVDVGDAVAVGHAGRRLRLRGTWRRGGGGRRCRSRRRCRRG